MLIFGAMDLQSSMWMQISFCCSPSRHVSTCCCNFVHHGSICIQDLNFFSCLFFTSRLPHTRSCLQCSILNFALFMCAIRWNYLTLSKIWVQSAFEASIKTFPICLLPKKESLLNLLFGRPQESKRREHKLAFKKVNRCYHVSLQQGHYLQCSKAALQVMTRFLNTCWGMANMPECFRGFEDTPVCHWLPQKSAPQTKCYRCPKAYFLTL